MYIYIMLYYSTIKKNEICPFSVNLDKLENTRLSEKSQRKTDTKYVSLICGIWNIKQMNVYDKTDTDSQT